MAIVREEKTDDEWSVKNSISLPKNIFGLLKSKSVSRNIFSSGGTVGPAEQIFHVPALIERFELPVIVREVIPFRLWRHTPIPELVGLYVVFRNARVAFGDR